VAKGGKEARAVKVAKVAKAAVNQKKTMTTCSIENDAFVKHISMSKEGVAVGVRVRPMLQE
jgi:hypothetical protein